MQFNLKTKFVIAVIMVILSLIIGAYTKVLFILHLPSYFDWWNFSWYILSWLLLFVAAFFVGKEVLEIADLYVKTKLQESYDLTIDLQKRGLEKGIETTKKGIATTKKGFAATKKGFETTHAFGKKTLALHKKMLGIEDIDFSSGKKNQWKRK